MPDFDETLLSAYLDGELPEAERARVEGWLAERPESRQVLEELRSIKTSLQRLPRDRLPHDFAEQVLRQAEREMLVCGGDAPRHGFSWRRWRRPAVWASLALAAGLLLMVFDRERPPPAAERQVALAPRDIPPERQMIGAPADEAAAPDAAVEGQASESRAARRPHSGVTAVPPAPRDLRLRHADEAPGPPRAAGTDMEGAKTSGGRMRQTQPPAGPAARTEDLAGNQPPAADAESLASAMLPDQALLVWCEVSPATKYNERFRQLLLSNSIQWSEEDDEQAAGLARANRGFGRKGGLGGTGGLGGKAAAKAPAEHEEAATAPAQNQRRLLEANQAALDANADLVLVEASEPQIKAILAELDRDTDVFMAVAVEPADDTPRQQQFDQYRRGALPAREFAQRKMGSLSEKNLATKAEPDRMATERTAQAAKPNSPPGVAYRLRVGRNAPLPTLQIEALDATKRAAAKANEDRLQVLFVLQPTGPAAAAAEETRTEKD